MRTIKEINIDTPEGRHLMAAMAIITTESRTDKTPDEVYNSILELADEMYPEKKIRNQDRAEEIINKHKRG
jgi:hypothetical protein